MHVRDSLLIYFLMKPNIEESKRVAFHDTEVTSPKSSIDKTINVDHFHSSYDKYYNNHLLMRMLLFML